MVLFYSYVSLPKGSHHGSSSALHFARRLDRLDLQQRHWGRCTVAGDWFGRLLDARRGVTTKLQPNPLQSKKCEYSCLFTFSSIQLHPRYRGFHKWGFPNSWMVYTPGNKRVSGYRFRYQLTCPLCTGVFLGNALQLFLGPLTQKQLTCLSSCNWGPWISTLIWDMFAILGDRFSQ